HVARLAAESMERARHLIGRARNVLGLVGVTFMVVLATASGVIVRVLYGAGHERTATIVATLSPTPAVLGFSTCYATLFLLAIGQIDAWRRVILSTVIVNFVSLGALLPWARPDLAVAVSCVIDELWVLVLSYYFWRKADVR